MPQAVATGSLGSAPRYRAPPPFACSWQLRGHGAAWVQVAGELDLVTSPQFRQMLAEARRAAPLIVLDLRELFFTDTSGIHVMLDVARAARREGGRLLIVRGPAHLDHVLTLTEVCKRALIFDLAPAEPALLHPVPSGAVT